MLDTNQIKLNKSNKKKRFKYSKEIIISLILSLIIISIIQKFFIIATIPSLSMYPTLKIGDKLYIKTNIDKIEKGKIYTFSKDGKKMIKRCIAAEGDHVVVKNDDIYINDIKLTERYVSSLIDATQIEMLVDLDLIVPKNKLFFLGDNRAVSFDSRYWDDHFVDENNIIGEAQYIIYPFNRVSTSLEN